MKDKVLQINLLLDSFLCTDEIRHTRHKQNKIVEKPLKKLSELKHNISSSLSNAISQNHNSIWNNPERIKAELEMRAIDPI